MQVIFGTLAISGLSSFLEPGNVWLLMNGFPDPNQAGVAATNFIVNVKHLANNSEVAVTGVRNAIGTQPVIIMTDVNPAGALMAHAMATPEFQARQAATKKAAAKVSRRDAKSRSSAKKRPSAAKASADQK